MEARFWIKVRRGADDECWEWLASKQTGGYGHIRIDGRLRLAHRVAWILTHGEIPEGLVVRHKCRGKCVNPAHLELGTQADNAADMVRDGTSTRGEFHSQVALTEDQVREIKCRLDDYERGMCVALAREYGVVRQTIGLIKSGRNWAWLTLEEPTQEPTGADGPA